MQLISSPCLTDDSCSTHTAAMRNGNLYLPGFVLCHQRNLTVYCKRQHEHPYCVDEDTELTQWEYGSVGDIRRRATRRMVVEISTPETVRRPHECYRSHLSAGIITMLLCEGYSGDEAYRGG